MEVDYLQVLRNIGVASESQKLNFANELLNDIGKFQDFIYKLFLSENRLLNNNLFLFALDFSVAYLSIPFIMYLNCEEFTPLLSDRMKTFNNVEKQNLDWIFNQIFRKFVNFEYKESNFEFLENILSFYSDFFGIDQATICKKLFSAETQNSQNWFEKIFNEAKTKIKIVLNSIQMEYYEEAEKMMLILKSIKINLSDFKNISERLIIKELIDEQETLTNILKWDFFKEERKDVATPLLNENKPSKKFKPADFSEKNAINLKDNTKELYKYTSIVYGTHVEFPEDLETEYKNYNFPLGEKQKFIMQKTICGFLNTQGGRIYIGIRDSDQKVVGLELTTKDQDNIVLEVDNLLKDITPYVESHECVTCFIPLKATNKEEDYIPGCYLVKIIVKKGKVNDLYFTSNLSYERRNAKCQVLEPAELKRKIMERSKVPESANLKNNEENKRFHDEKPEIGIRKFMKIPMHGKQNVSEIIVEHKLKKKKNKNKGIDFQNQNFMNKKNQNKNTEIRNETNVEQQNLPKFNHQYNNNFQNNKMNNVIFIAVQSNPNILPKTRENFKSQIIPFLKTRINELLPKSILSFLVSLERMHIYVEAINNETALLIKEIVEDAQKAMFTGFKFIIDFALFERYKNLINSKDFKAFSLE